jgi:hypothetical protein
MNTHIVATDALHAGVLFDVYDNDNKRNNPSIFVLNNMNGTDCVQALVSSLLLSQSARASLTYIFRLLCNQPVWTCPHLISRSYHSSTFFSGSKTFNHDNDYENDMEKGVPDVVPGHVGDSSSVYKSHKCVSDFRNTGRPFVVCVCVDMRAF